MVQESKRADVLIDVDYYLDMNNILKGKTNPTYLYTVTPEDAGAVLEDYSYSFSDNKINMRIAGGGNYSHRLWHYPDVLSVFGWDFEDRCLGIFPRLSLTIFNVEHRKVGHTRSIVGIFPDARLVGLPALLSWYFCEHTTLSRLITNPTPEFTALRIYTRTPFLSIAFAGSCYSVNLTECEEALVHASAIKTDSSKSGLSVMAIQAVLKEEKSRDRSQIVESFYSRVGNRMLRTPTYFVPDPEPHERESVKNYTFGDPGDTGKASVLPFMNPIVDGCYAPTVTPGNERRSIDHRVIKAANTAKISAHLARAMNAFLIRLLPEGVARKGAFADLQEIEEKQNRPEQRMKQKQSEPEGHEPPEPVKCFMKPEPAEKLADPRNISVLPKQQQIKYSRATYPPAKYLKQFPCYGSGKTPRAIAEHLASVCAAAKFLTCGDFSRMDGHECEPGRALYTAFMRRFYSIEYQTELNTMLEQQYGRKAVGRFRTEFDVGLSRLSGSPETSLANTIVNYFIGFLSRYNGISRGPDEEKEIDQAFYLATHKDSYNGDDSVMIEVDQEAYKKAARMMGHVVTSDRFERGDSGVNYLSRVYSPLIWYGDPASMFSILRALRKFHTTTKRTQTTEEFLNMKLVEKCRSAACSDGQTPIMRVLCRKAAEFSKGMVIKTTSDTAYNVRVHGEDNQYPQNNTNGWMDHEFHKTVGAKETIAIEKYFEECKTLTDLRNIPPLYFPADPAPIPEGAGVNVNGEYFENCKEKKRVSLSPEVQAAREKGFSVNAYVSPDGTVSAKQEDQRPTIPPIVINKIVAARPTTATARNENTRTSRLNPRRRKAQQRRSQTSSRSTTPSQETTKQINAVAGVQEGKSSRNTGAKWRKLRKTL